MKLSRVLYDEMVSHARAEAPNECCGMVATSNGVAHKVYPAVNAAARTVVVSPWATTTSG